MLGIGDSVPQISVMNILDDDWEDDYLFSQPCVMQMVDQCVQQALKNKTPSSSTTDTTLKSDSSALQCSSSTEIEKQNVNAFCINNEIAQQPPLQPSSPKSYEVIIQQLREELMIKTGEAKILRDWKTKCEREEFQRLEQTYAEQQKQRDKEQQMENEFNKQLNNLKSEIRFIEMEKQSCEKRLQEERKLRHQLELRLSDYMSKTFLRHSSLPFSEIQTPPNMKRLKTDNDQKQLACEFPDRKRFYSGNSSFKHRKVPSLHKFRDNAYGSTKYNNKGVPQPCSPVDYQFSECYIPLKPIIYGFIELRKYCFHRPMIPLMNDDNDNLTIYDCLNQITMLPYHRRKELVARANERTSEELSQLIDNMPQVGELKIEYEKFI
ncbi:ATR-interacting protein [Trichinella pseudospiralis]